MAMDDTLNAKSKPNAKIIVTMMTEKKQASTETTLERIVKTFTFPKRFDAIK